GGPRAVPGVRRADDAPARPPRLLPRLQQVSQVQGHPRSAAGALGWAYLKLPVSRFAGRNCLMSRPPLALFTAIKRMLQGTYISVMPWHLFRYLYHRRSGTTSGQAKMATVSQKCLPTLAGKGSRTQYRL